ncbi:MAG: hypothetical protein LBQ89_05750 [Treponema sp.]|nr:hypothetical protein [Treponema sp.]
MSNFKWGLTAAVAALVISVGIGLLFGVSIINVILRALVFAAVFFGIGFGLRLLIDSFFPELLLSDGETEKLDFLEQPHSRVDITLDTKGEYAVPELYKTPSDPQELGNIEDLISGNFMSRPAGIDRKREEGYNNADSIKSVHGERSFDFQDVPDQESFSFADTSAFEKPSTEKPVFSTSFEDDSGGLGGLPDLDLMAMAFSTGWAPSVAGTVADGNAGHNDGQKQVPAPHEELPEQSRYTGNKPQSLKGDFNPKELAEGIRTVLSKSK